MAHDNAPTSDREIQEDIVNVSVLAWLGGVSTILLTVTVLLLMGVFYMTTKDLDDVRQAEAALRITPIKAQGAIDALVVDGYFEHPDSDDGQGNITRGTVSIPVAVGMQQVIQDAKR